MADTLHVPGSYPSDLPSGENQRAAVESFYASATFDMLSDEQGGRLLDYRDYARAVVERVAPEYYREDARALAEKVAIYISRDREIAEAVVVMMRRRFEKAADPDGLKGAVARLAYFEDIEAACEDAMS